MRDRGFTLIEILIVIAVIALLASLLLVGGRAAMRAAKVYDTTQRMQNLLASLNTYRSHQGGAAYQITQALALSADKNYVMPNAWGRELLFLNPPAPTPAFVQPDMKAMNPLLSQGFLQLAELCEPGSAYKTDRNTGRAWNDRWGNPLVAAYLLFEPYQPSTPIPFYSPPTSIPQIYVPTGTGSRIATDAELHNEARKRYGTNRILYLAVASACENQVDGTIPKPTWDLVMQSLQNEGKLWGGASFSAPPFQGVYKTIADGRLSLVSQPMEIR